MMKRKIMVINKNENDIHVKELNEIVYLKSLGCKTKTCCCDGHEYLLKNCLSHIEEKLPNEKFFRIHKSFIINIDYLKGINVNGHKTVLLHNGIELNVACRKYKRFMDFVKEHFVLWQ